ncbi:hypothetical protein EV286_11164 [Rhizobium sp. BK251]|nr:hypothetical protein EV286_11164 [Rhizobium sp. BK251]
MRVGAANAFADDPGRSEGLDYAGGSPYRQALRSAEARGLHLMNVARTLVRDRLEWTVSQKQKLVDLAGRLRVIGAKLGLQTSAYQTVSNIAKEAKSMVSGVTKFPKTIDQTVGDKLAADPALKAQWEEVSTRIRKVYAQPEAAFRAVNVDAMLANDEVGRSTIAKVAADPEAFGAIKGKMGMFASRANKADRKRALNNITALASSLSDYLRQRGGAERRNQAKELAARRKVAAEIPALSSGAKTVLERVRGAVDRNDLPSSPEYALSDKLVKAELEGFARAVAERLGERTFLPLAAKSADGEAFPRLTESMSTTQRSEVQSAWTLMRTVQQLSAHERSAITLKQAESMRQSKSQGLTLK